MHTQIRQLKQKHAKLIADARACYEQIKEDTPSPKTKELNNQFDDIMVDANICKRQIENLEQLQESENHLNGSSDTRTAGINLNTPAANYETWRDRDGREVRVHDGRQPIQFTSESNENPAFNDLSLGRVLRGLLKPSTRTKLERRALGEATDAAGGVTVPIILLQQFIDNMRTRSQIFRAGARVVEMGSNVVDIARVMTDPTVAWRDENANVGTSDPVFNKVSFSAKSLGLIIPVSKEMIMDTVNLESVLEAIFAGNFAAEIDRAALFGSGTDPEPQGIFGTTGILETSMGTNGAAITDYSEIITAHQKLMEANAMAPTANIMAPRTWGAYANFQDTTGQPLMKPQQIADTPDLVSTNVPVDQTQGTANNASSIITGDFTQLLIGIRLDMTIQVLNERYADKAQTGFLVWWRGDVQTAHPDSFHVIKGITQ